MLTRKQANVLAFIERYTAELGFAPSLREIAAEVGGTSQGNIQRMVGALIERGYVRRIPGQHRGIEVIKALRAPAVPAPAAHVCPHCGEPLSVRLIARAA